MRLQISGVGVQIEGHDILSDVTALCPSGEVTGLLGPNGSGKSTLLGVVAGLRRPTTGTVQLDDLDLHRLPARRRARLVALVEQQSATGLNLTARDVVALGRIPHRSRFTPRDNRGAEIVQRSLVLADAEQYADRPWPKLSGGEQQRIHLARALAQEPTLLLLDEPTNHLDLAHQLRFLEVARGLGITTLVALHDLNLAAAYCDSVAILDEGRLVRHGPVASVLDDDVVADVYRVDVTVGPHPARANPHIRWNRPLEDHE